MRREGLLLRTPRWQERLTVRTAEQVEGEGLVLLAVKSQHTAQVLPQLRGRRVAVCQNGLENEELVATVAARVHPVMLYVPAQHLEPGVVDLHGEPHPGVVDSDDEELAAAFRSAGLDSRALPDVMAWKRTKTLTNLGGALQALGWPMGQVGALWDEGEAVFAAAGLPYRSMDELMDRVGDFDLGLIDGEARIGGSTLQDHRRGRELETPWLNGHIVRLGRHLGVPTPANQAVLEALESR